MIGASYHLITGDALEQLRLMPADSVHCVVTSPPYWSLRDYRAKGQLGLEDTPEEFVERLVGVFAEVRRVLRPEGTCWVNLGDVYAQSGRGKVGDKSTLNGRRYCHDEASRALKERGGSYRRPPPGYKPKDLVGLPWMVAFALRSAGWWLRADIVWEKPNAMPEPVLDRPTRSHEYVFLLSKSEIYFYDDVAVRERVTGTAHSRGEGSHPKATQAAEGVRSNASFARSVRWLATHRNRRTVWSILTAPYSEAHFATFPEALAEPCVRAGTSEHGCCSSCGAPVERQTERIRTLDGEPAPEFGAFRNKSKDEPGNLPGHGHGRIATEVRTLGWERTCTCAGADLVPCTVLDPFAGSGTTGAVALAHGRRFVGIDLNPEYIAMADRRLSAVAPLFSQRSAAVHP